MEHVEKHMNTCLDELLPEKLEETSMATNDDGKPVEVTAEDVLIHVWGVSAAPRRIHCAAVADGLQTAAHELESL
jgi:hypothetical protein